MRNKVRFSLLLSLLLVVLVAVPALAEDENDDMDEWTVMFYLCGSDLESKYGYATGNLEEIKGVSYMASPRPKAGMRRSRCVRWPGPTTRPPWMSRGTAPASGEILPTTRPRMRIWWRKSPSR